MAVSTFMKSGQIRYACWDGPGQEAGISRMRGRNRNVELADLQVQEAVDLELAKKEGCIGCLVL